MEESQRGMVVKAGFRARLWQLTIEVRPVAHT